MTQVLDREPSPNTAPPVPADASAGPVDVVKHDEAGQQQQRSTPPKAPTPVCDKPAAGDDNATTSAADGKASDGEAKPAEKPARNLVVSQLPRSIDTANLRAMFSEFGELVTALVMMDVQSGRSRGFGFVWFKEPADAQNAMKAMDGRVLDEGGKPLKVFPSDHPDGLSEAAAISVLNVPSSLAHGAGRELFGQFGRLVRYEPQAQDGRASGSGSAGGYKSTITVEYETIEQARAAVNALHGVRQLRFGTTNVNLQLPLVTKYLIPTSIDYQRASRPASRGGSHRPTPSNSASSAHHGYYHQQHVLAPAGFAPMPHTGTPMMHRSPNNSSSAMMSHGPMNASGHVAYSTGSNPMPGPPPRYGMHAQQTSPGNSGHQVFSLPQQQQVHSHVFGQLGGSPQPQQGQQQGQQGLPPGYVMVPVNMVYPQGQQGQQQGQQQGNSNGQQQQQFFMQAAPQQQQGQPQSGTPFFASPQASPQQQQQHQQQNSNQGFFFQASS